MALLVRVLQHGPAALELIAAHRQVQRPRDPQRILAGACQRNGQAVGPGAGADGVAELIDLAIPDRHSDAGGDLAAVVLLEIQAAGQIEVQFEGLAFAGAGSNHRRRRRRRGRQLLGRQIQLVDVVRHQGEGARTRRQMVHELDVARAHAADQGVADLQFVDLARPVMVGQYAVDPDVVPDRAGEGLDRQVGRHDAGPQHQGRHAPLAIAVGRRLQGVTVVGLLGRGGLGRIDGADRHIARHHHGRRRDTGPEGAADRPAGAAADPHGHGDDRDLQQDLAHVLAAAAPAAVGIDDQIDDLAFLQHMIQGLVARDHRPVDMQLRLAQIFGLDPALRHGVHQHGAHGPTGGLQQCVRLGQGPGRQDDGDHAVRRSRFW